MVRRSFSNTLVNDWNWVELLPWISAPQPGVAPKSEMQRINRETPLIPIKLTSFTTVIASAEFKVLLPDRVTS